MPSRESQNYESSAITARKYHLKLKGDLYSMKTVSLLRVNLEDIASEETLIRIEKLLKKLPVQEMLDHIMLESKSLIKPFKE